MKAKLRLQDMKPLACTCGKCGGKATIYSDGCFCEKCSPAWLDAFLKWKHEQTYGSESVT